MTTEKISRKKKSQVKGRSIQDLQADVSEIEDICETIRYLKEKGMIDKQVMKELIVKVLEE